MFVCLLFKCVCVCLFLTNLINTRVENFIDLFFFSYIENFHQYLFLISRIELERREAEARRRRQLEEEEQRRKAKEVEEQRRRELEEQRRRELAKRQREDRKYSQFEK